MDEHGDRIHIYPRQLFGRWLKRRTVVNLVLMAVYFGLPWLTVGGNQAVLFDIPRRKMALFGLVLWPQDTVLLWLFLFTALVGIFFFTALFGRVWCGWACPQTVFMEGVFRHIERWIEGRPAARRKRDAGPWTLDKAWRKGLKHAVFLLIAAHVANTFLCYFAGTDRVLDMTTSSPSQAPAWFGFMAGITAVFYFDFAWFREQLCTMACPYGRWQSVLIDRHSLLVGYDEKRGEGRARMGVRRAAAKAEEATGASGQTFGDCVDCSLCVQVCPTGIDIRDGLQLECVGCTACIDACDAVMTKVGKPEGLIRYASLAALDGERRRLVRPRSIIYGVVMVLAAGLFVAKLATRADIEVQVVRAQRNAVQMVGDEVLNHFRAKLVNKSDEPIKVKVDVPGERVAVPLNPWPVPAASAVTMEIFVKRPKSAFGADVERVKMLFSVDAKPVHDAEVPLLGPGMRH